jgi:tetratricopeptide (TPR) repeat protein
MDVRVKSTLFAAILLVVSCTTQGAFEEGKKLSQAGKFEEATIKYQEALRDNPTDPQIHNMLGMAYRMQNKTADKNLRASELSAFLKAIEVDDKFWVAHKNAAATLYYAGRKAEAVKHCERSLKLFPNDPEKDLLLKWIEEGKAMQQKP